MKSVFIYPCLLLFCFVLHAQEDSTDAIQDPGPPEEIIIIDVPGIDVADHLRIEDGDNGKLGLYDKRQDRLILPVVYDKIIGDIDNGKTFIVGRDNKMFLVNNENETISKLYDNIMRSETYQTRLIAKVYPFESVLINTLGEEISSRYSYMSDNYACKKNFSVSNKEGKYGMIDSNGAVTIPLIYEDISTNYENNTVSVRKGELHGVVDFDNNVLVDIKYESKLYPFIPGYYKLGIIGSVGLVKERGGLVVPREYLYFRDVLDNFHDTTSLILVDIKDTVSGKIMNGVIDLNANHIIPCVYDYLRFFDDEKSESRLLAYNEDLYGVIDFNNNIVLPLKYSSLTNVPYKDIKSHLKSHPKDIIAFKNWDFKKSSYLYIVTYAQDSARYLINEKQEVVHVFSKDE